MTNVTKHDSEEEGESDDCKESRIDFLVGSDTVRVDDSLESRGELVGRVECRWVFECATFMEDSGDICSCLVLERAFLESATACRNDNGKRRLTDASRRAP
jgi:hypothetical protein